MTRKLLGYGADINMKDDKGRTTLHQAVQDEEDDVVELLSDRGTDHDLKNHKGRTARRLASKGREKEDYSYFQVVRRLNRNVKLWGVYLLVRRRFMFCNKASHDLDYQLYAGVGGNS